jgi:hypothetical protein
LHKAFDFVQALSPGTIVVRLFLANDIIQNKVAGVKTQQLPSFWMILWVSIVLCLVGWGGLVLLVFITLPTLAPRWLFFFLLTLALSGLALPIAYFLNRRFPTEPPVDGGTVLREAMWVGIYGCLLAWLQMGRVLTSGLVFILALGLVVVELLLRLGERSLWQPSRPRSTAAATDGNGSPVVDDDGSEGDESEDDFDDEDEEDD